MTSNNNNADRSNTGLLHSTAGASSGAITRLISQPLDVIKIRFQVNTVFRIQFFILNILYYTIRK